MRTRSRAVWRKRSFCVLDGDFQLFLKCLDLSGKMLFPLLHRKGLRTPANTHQLNSVCWTHTLMTVLLGSSVLVLEADISQYSVYSHSLWNTKTQPLEETSSNSLRLNADSTLLVRWTRSRAVLRKRSFFFYTEISSYFLNAWIWPGKCFFRFFTERVYKLLQTHISLTL